MRSVSNESMLQQPTTSRAPSHHLIRVDQPRRQQPEEDMIASAARVISELRISLSTCSMPERMARQMANRGLKSQQLRQLKRSLHQVNQPQVINEKSILDFRLQRKLEEKVKLFQNSVCCL